MSVHRPWSVPTLLLMLLVASGLATAPSHAVTAEWLTVSGTLSSPTGALASAWVAAYDDQGQRVGRDEDVEPDGQYEVSFRPSEESETYHLEFSGYTAAADPTVENGFTVFETLEVAGDRTLDVTVDAVPFEVRLEDENGADVEGDVQLSCYEEGEGIGSTEDGPVRTKYRSLVHHARGTGVVSLYVLAPPVPSYGCRLLVVPVDGSKKFDRFGLAVGDPMSRTYTVPDPVTLSGTVGTDDGPATTTHVVATDAQGFEVAEFYDDSSDGTYALRLAPGTYDLRLRGQTANEDYTVVRRGVAVDTEPTVVDALVDTAPVDVHLVRTEGDVAAEPVEVSCARGGGAGVDFVSITSTRTGTGVVTPLGLVSTGESPETCYVPSTIGGGPSGLEPPEFTVDADGAELTLELPSRRLLLGAPDADGVPGDTESQAPNNGDGNDDGVPDAQQAHVTSLPANGAPADGTAEYVTVEAPEGVALTDVATFDPADAATPPPTGTTLPRGLVSFVLAGVPNGSDQTVSLFMGSTEGINGYAKYDVAADAWTVLPADRVTILPDRVVVRLTDGGEGDDDGIENGEISDPGGMAILPLASDTTPPVVTGTPTTSPNGAGWYRGDVVVDWSATDEGSGVATQPEDTVVATEGSAVTAVSPEVCDQAPSPNCATGTVTGLRIDRTAPTVSLDGVEDGATYLLGAVPEATCTASDDLSGLAAPCRTGRWGGNRNGVGAFTHAATAVDEAGNRQVTRVRYRVVYRVDGFLAPLNNPPAATSVFRRGATVPVGIVLTRADGRVVAPVTRPAWVTPVRGSATTLPVNESAGWGRGSTGSTLSWRNGRWAYDWSTRGLPRGYLYRIGVRLDDGTTRQLTVGLR